MNCPKCGEECERDSVDIGVGVMHGPWGCSGCRWSEDSYYDRSEGPSEAQKENPEWYVDQWGRMQRISAIADRGERFGIPRKLVEDAFRIEKETER